MVSFIYLLGSWEYRTDLFNLPQHNTPTVYSSVVHTSKKMMQKKLKKGVQKRATRICGGLENMPHRD